MKIETIGIIGNGQFSKLMQKYLAPYFALHVYDRKDENTTLEKVCKSDIVIFAIPVQSLEESCREVSKFVNEETVVMDVTSVKVRPLEILKKYFPDNPILGTHPIFGPQTEKDLGGIKSLPIVLSDVSVTDELYNNIVHFLSSVLELKIIEQTPDEHDKDMAKVQGLSHFIGRALSHMNIDYLPTGTHSYNQLVKLQELVGTDSWGLFETIQNNNPYICDMRQEFIDELRRLEDKLGNIC